MRQDLHGSVNRSDQEKFYTVYRGRQSWLHHLAYMRTGKVKAVELVLRRNGIDLAGLSIFDFGFGPGTLLRRCDTTCRLAGVELDIENVIAVRRMLERRGHDASGIQTSQIDAWSSHPLLEGGVWYDVIVLSHVLEHLTDPTGTLRRLQANLVPGSGRIVGVVPINERVADEAHKWRCSRAVLLRWAEDSALEIEDYVELDHWMYWVLPIAHAKGIVGRVVWQGISVVLGMGQAAFSPARWFSLGELAGKLTRARPAQAAFVLAPRS